MGPLGRVNLHNHRIMHMKLLKKTEETTSTGIPFQVTCAVLLRELDSVLL